MPTKKEETMQLITPNAKDLPPLPRPENKQLVQAEVNEDIYEQMQVEMKRSGITKIRTVIEYGIKCFNARAHYEAGLTQKAKSK